MQSRDITYFLKRASKVPVVIISGPKESGKTTLIKTVFKNHKYLSFEDTDTRMFATNDPERFFTFYKNDVGIILDEVQKVPSIFLHIQREIGARKKPGFFILISSEKIAPETLNCFTEKISTLTLLPFSLKELTEYGISRSVDEHILQGGHPSIADEDVTAFSLYPAFLQSFIEREVSTHLQTKNVPSFHKFMQLCAGQIGQLVNLDALGEECGVSFATARQWLALLEKHYIVFLLPPHTKTFNKRITKTPKLYFFNTGLACALLRITTTQVLCVYPLRGKLFENFMIADLYKQCCNGGQTPSLFFWRDQNGRHEVDCLIDTGSSLVALEIKSGETLARDAFKRLENWNKITDSEPSTNYLIYAGSDIQEKEAGTLIGWQSASELIEQINP